MKKTLITIIIVLGVLNTSLIVSSFSITKDLESDLTVASNSEDLNLNLKKGDIVTRNVDADRFPLFQNFKHPLMYTGEIKTLSDGSIEYAFIEANGGKGVCYWNYSEKDLKEDIHEIIYRVVNATDRQIDNAVAFAKSQLGKPFQTIIEQMMKNYNPIENDSWYCTEIIWAAYFNCDFHPDKGIYGFGINIDAYPGAHVWPWDIWDSDETIEFPLFSAPTENKIKQTNLLFRNNIFRIFINLRNIYNICLTG